MVVRQLLRAVLTNLKALKMGDCCVHSNETGVRLSFPLYLRLALNLAQNLRADEIIKPHKKGPGDYFTALRRKKKSSVEKSLAAERESPLRNVHFLRKRQGAQRAV